VRSEDAVEGREVKVGRRHEGDEALHQGLGCQREGLALLRRVLVPPVLETAQPAVRDGPAGAISGITVDE
jgi:hypothetical protein